MKTQSLIILLVLISLNGWGQRHIDTFIEYNGKRTQIFIEYDKNVLKEKETKLNAQGKIEEEHFYTNNKLARWISYDSLGKEDVSWQDPEIGYSKHRQRVYTCLSIAVLLVISATWYGSRRIGYRKTYLILGYTTMFLSVADAVLQRYINFYDTNIWLTFLFASFLLCLPAVLLILSFANLSRNTGVSIITSVIFILFSMFLTMLYAVNIIFTGVGLLS